MSDSRLPPLIARPLAPYVEALSEPIVPSRARRPDYEGLVRSVRREFVDQPQEIVGREAQVASIRHALSRGVAVRSLYGGGKSSFGMAALRDAVVGGRTAFLLDLQAVPGGTHPEAVRAYVQDLAAEAAQRYGVAASAVLGGECTFLVDELNELYQLPHAAQTLEYLKQLAAQPNVHLIAPVHDVASGDAFVEALDLHPYTLPPPSLEAVRQMFQGYADDFGVTFVPDAIATLTYQAQTPQNVMRGVETALKVAWHREQRSGVVDAATVSAALTITDFEVMDSFVLTDQDLLCRLMLQQPYQPRSDAERARLDRWVTYDLARPVEGGYGLTRTVFTLGLRALVSTEVEAEALALQPVDPDRAAKVLNDALFMGALRQHSAGFFDRVSGGR